MGFGSEEFASPQNPACWSACQTHGKMFNLANLKVSQQQSHLADNFQAAVIISVLDPYSRVGVCGTGQTEMAGPAPARDFSSHLEVTDTWQVILWEMRGGSGRERACTCNIRPLRSSVGFDLKRWWKEVFG